MCHRCLSCLRCARLAWCLERNDRSRKPQASDILEASVEAGLTLREVEDVVFSNTRTLEFFNSADYKQVMPYGRVQTAFLWTWLVGCFELECSGAPPFGVFRHAT